MANVNLNPIILTLAFVDYAHWTTVAAMEVIHLWGVTRCSPLHGPSALCCLKLFTRLLIILHHQSIIPAKGEGRGRWKSSHSPDWTAAFFMKRFTTTRTPFYHLLGQTWKGHFKPFILQNHQNLPELIGALPKTLKVSLEIYTKMAIVQEILIFTSTP